MTAIILSAMWPVILALSFIAFGGMALLCVWHPIQRFLVLREDVAARIVLFKQERARCTASHHDGAPRCALLKEEHLLAWRNEFNDLAFKMRSFAETQRIATWTLQRLKLDPLKVEAG